MRNDAMSTDCLLISSISKEYKKGKVKANRNINASFRPGELTAVIGHNGAGKTTLLNQVVGIVKPNSGDITYNGYSLVKDTKMARNIVSMMPQFHAPLSGVTLYQSIESILRIRGVSGKHINAYVEQMMSELDIQQWAKRSGDKLSGGLQRLVSFAMAVVYPAPIILLDEPTNDVDPVRRKRVWQHMRKLAQRGHIVVVVTHNLLEVEQYADRYLLLNNGELIQDAPIGDLSKNFASNTLTATINDVGILDSAPEAIEIRFVEEESRVVYTLSAEQVPQAIDWILKMIEKGEISSYRLSSESLDVSYGGMTDEK